MHLGFQINFYNVNAQVIYKLVTILKLLKFRKRLELKWYTNDQDWLEGNKDEFWLIMEES
jgi:hypothetical protein